MDSIAIDCQCGQCDHCAAREGAKMKITRWMIKTSRGQKVTWAKTEAEAREKVQKKGVRVISCKADRTMEVEEWSGYVTTGGIAIKD